MHALNYIDREKAKAMFYHGYDSYLKYAYPYDELRPLSCAGQDTWGRLVEK
jgi:mannosidase alpha-like ER degradation enhancer 2